MQWLSIALFQFSAEGLVVKPANQAAYQKHPIFLTVRQNRILAASAQALAGTRHFQPYHDYVSDLWGSEFERKLPRYNRKACCSIKRGTAKANTRR